MPEDYPYTVHGRAFQPSHAEKSSQIVSDGLFSLARDFIGPSYPIYIYFF